MILNYRHTVEAARLRGFARRVLPMAARAASALVLAQSIAGAQERPANRVANIVGVAVEEYGKGIDASSRIISQLEYEEAVTFLADARDAMARLSGDRADSARVTLDTLIALAGRRVSPAVLAPWVDQFMGWLGADAALELPTRPVDLPLGARLYSTHCASCHGASGMGDGPAGIALSPPPPAIGSAADMRDVSPGLMYRVSSVGIPGTAMAGFAEQLTPDERWSIISWITSRRAPAPRAEGEGLYMQLCASCHGAQGASNGPLTAALSALPVELSSFAWQAQRSDAQIAEVVWSGVAGTAMPPTRDLSDADVDRIVAFVRTLSLDDVPVVAHGSGARDPDAAAREVLAQLNSALAAVRAGRAREASDRAFDAYIAFEPLETPARARSPGIVAALERQFADFKGAVRANDLREAERARNAIEQGMPELLALTRTSAGTWGAFLQSLLIILREGFEAILVIGAIVALLIKTGHRERLRSIWMGVGLALGASAVTAVVLATALRALPATREAIEGFTMLVAVAVLFSVSYWLISKVEAARWQQFIRDKVDAALSRGGGTALALVAFLAVYREGAETALFYQALLQEGSGTVVPIVLGVVVGGAVLAVVFTIFHRYGVRIPLRPFFGVTSVLLYYLAFVFMGKGIRELQEGNLVSITVLPGWPHIDALGIFPSVETLLAQLLLLVLFVFALLRTFWPRRAVALPMVALAREGNPVAGEVQAIAERLDSLERRIDAVEQSVDAAGNLADTSDASLPR